MEVEERPRQRLRFPFADAPDIIRANQKDVFYQEELFKSMSVALRNLYGARFVHKYTSEIRTLTEALLLGCTTLLGNRTLGEEYCDIIQVEKQSVRLPALARRATYIVSVVLIPYIMEKNLPRIRGFLDRRFGNNSQAGGEEKTQQSTTSRILSQLPSLMSFGPIYAMHLSIFYFTGSYYHISKRIAGLRYIFSKNSDPSSQKVGYEVLGVLLVLQMTFQSVLQLKESVDDQAAASNSGAKGLSVIADINEDETLRARSSQLEGDDGHQAVTYEDEESRYDLASKDVMAWIQSDQQRKCTLCLEYIKDPSATTCGHMFCWTCITDWIREKPECPLCRQSILAQHVLPLRG